MTKLPGSCQGKCQGNISGKKMYIPKVRTNKTLNYVSENTEFLICHRKMISVPNIVV